MFDVLDAYQEREHSYHGVQNGVSPSAIDWNALREPTPSLIDIETKSPIIELIFG